MRKKPKWPDAKCNRLDCFGCKGGYCKILTDTDFGKRKCPFFKTKLQYAQGLLGR